MQKPATNSSYPKGGVSCSKGSLVVNQPLVFQILFFGKGPALRLAAKVSRPCKTDTATIKETEK